MVARARLATLACAAACSVSLVVTRVGTASTAGVLLLALWRGNTAEMFLVRRTLSRRSSVRSSAVARSRRSSASSVPEEMAPGARVSLAGRHHP